MEERSNTIPYLIRRFRNTFVGNDDSIPRYPWPVTRDDLKLLGYRNKHQADRVFVIGNGPSLKLEDLEQLKNEVCIACNKVYLAYNLTSWRPSYYFAEDVLVVKQNIKVLHQLTGYPKFFPRHLLNWSPRINGGIYFHQIVNQHFYPCTPGFSTSPIAGFYWGSTVVYSMIQFAAFAGAKKIYLLGVDCDFNISSDVLDENTKEITVKADKNHFLPNYRESGEKWYPPNLHMQEKTFQCAAEWCRKSGVSIVNCSRGGKLEAFPRANLEDVFGHTGSAL